MKKSFGVLRTIAVIMKIMGVVIAALALLGGLVIFVLSFAGGDVWSFLGTDTTTGFFIGVLMAFVVVVFGAFYALILYGYGEMIYLLLALEENTHNTVLLLEKSSKID